MNIPRFIFTLVISLFLVGPVSAQAIREQDIRAELGFLASDAMQGRGSGTPWEHATAEYVGSQFMQFGLEPAGEAGFDGKPTYVQTVDVAGRENMTNLKIDNGTGADVVYGRDWAAFGMTAKTLIIFFLSVFPFVFNAYAGVRAVDPLLINVVRSLGGKELDLYFKVIVPSVLPYVVAGARIAVGRALIGVLVGEFFAASEGIGYAIARFGDLYALDKMFACIIVIMVIAVVLTEGIRWAERAAFPWRAGQ